MGTLQLSEFRVDLRYQLGNRSDLDYTASSEISDRLDHWINRAYRWVSLPKVYRHPELKARDTITLVDGTTRYSVPSDLYAIRFLINETQEFKYDPAKDLDFLDQGSTSRLYAREGQVILITGDSQNDADTVRVYYWQKPTDLSGDTDTTSLGDYFDDVVLSRATAIAAAAIGELSRADWFNSYAVDLINDHTSPETLEAEDSGWENPHIRTGTQNMRSR